jgi:transcriptional regulator with XRE-family HTH domain
MKVKDQIKVRREQLGISVNELAKRLGVSSQAIRHWENGRSFPGKSKTAALETALSLNIDWTEGSRAAAKRPQISGLIDPNDVSLLLNIARLPTPAKSLIADLVEMYVTLDGRAGSFAHRGKESSAEAFHEKESQGESARGTKATRAPKPGAKGSKNEEPDKRHSTRRKAA